MPSVSSKGKSKPAPKPAGAPRSRNSTPLEPAAAAYLKAPMRSLLRDGHVSLHELLDRGGGVAQIPSGASLNTMREAIHKRVLEPARHRTEDSDKLLRELQKMRSHSHASRSAPDRDSDDRKHKLKKVRSKREPDDERPLAVGAHGVARQDGVDVHKDQDSTASSPISQPPPSASGTAPPDAPSPSGSEASHQPPPAPAVPQFQTFGPDPSKFDDPTVYHIRHVEPGMSEDEIKEIYCVAEYPHSDLHDFTPGTPPDKDFSNAKPASQVNASVFANYVEPYIRPLTEEDVAFLKERGDRQAPFLMPVRGPRHYKDIWADEDGAMHVDSNDGRLAPNEARGSYDDVSDEMLGTDIVSAGPLTARLLGLLRPEGRGVPAQEPNGVNLDAMDIDEGGGAPPDANNTNALPAATQLPDFLKPNWQAPPTMRTDYATLEERVMTEFRHYNMIMDADDVSQYDSHFDDEVAARLRLLQSELRKQSIINGARKQRLLELTEERMAQQEYNTIADDLDNQLNAAYLKRNRNMGKGKKQTKRPGGAGGGSHPVPNAGAGVSRPGVGEPIRILMERKSMWNSTIGPVVNYGKTGLPKEEIFSADKMKEFENKEVEAWNAETEEA